MNTIQYYEQNYEKIFNAVEFPNWRIWKIVDENGAVYQSKRQITKPIKLLKFIKKCKNPQKLYTSISTFLNSKNNHGRFKSQKVCYTDRYSYPKPGYIYADCLFLDTYFFIDLDSESDLRIAQEDGRKIIRYLQDTHNLTPFLIQFSGNKGIHIIYTGICTNTYTDPYKRLEACKAIKQQLSKELLTLGLKTIDDTHLNIMQDNFRVYAATHSIKGNGNIVLPLGLDQFMNQDIYNFLRNVSPQRMAMDPKGNDEKVACAEGPHPLASHLYCEEERDSLSSLHFDFVDNIVNGLKDCYVTVIKKNKANFKVQELQLLQSEYNLSDFIIFGIEDDIYAVNTKIVQYPRLLKILRRIKASNLNFFASRKHQYIPLSNIEPIGILKSEFGQNHQHSRPHSKLFGLTYKKMVGKENKIYEMNIK
jgi:hypothetical protein